MDDRPSRKPGLLKHRRGMGVRVCVQGEAKENCESLRGQFYWASFTRIRHLGSILGAVERLQRIEKVE